MRPTSVRPAVDVLGVAVDAINMQHCLDYIEALVQGPGKNYICAAGVHGVMEAQRDPEVFQAYKGSAITVPDGMPLVWTGWLQSFPCMARVAGPDLMLEVFHDARLRHLRHFLYGGQPGVAEDLRASLQARFPDAQIVGTYTPPFRDLNEDELAALQAELSAAEVDVMWIGISCPRQEIFMARYSDRLSPRLMLGVGAAFDYHTGRIRDCAPWIKHAGLQWLHRLVQEPRRLWKRYARNNPLFVWRIIAQLLRTGGSQPTPHGEPQPGAAATRH